MSLVGTLSSRKPSQAANNFVKPQPLYSQTGQAPTLDESGLKYGSKKPLKLGKKVAEAVKECVFALSSGGSIISGAVISGAIHGILSVEDSSKLADNGGNIDVNDRSIIQRMYKRYGLVKRRGTSGRAYIDIDEMNRTKSQFVKEIEKLVIDNSIPAELIINYDETGLPICPVGDYTMDVKGATNVHIANKGILVIIIQTLIIQSVIIQSPSIQLSSTHNTVIIMHYMIFLIQVIREQLLVSLLVRTVVNYCRFNLFIKVPQIVVIHHKVHFQMNLTLLIHIRDSVMS